MSYFTEKAKTLPKNARNHPWCEMFSRSLERTDPARYAEYVESGELDDYVAVMVHEAQAMMDAEIKSGTDPAVAKQLALEHLAPADPDEIQTRNWELSGGQEAQIAALEDHLKNR